MARITTLVAVVVSLACMSAGATAQAARFHGDVAGTATGPGHQFMIGDGLYLRFRDSNRSYTAYKVCYSRGHGTACYRRTTGRAGHISRIFFTPEGVGNYTARWYVRGRQVASWSWYNAIGD